MRINELIVENIQTDEGIGSALGKAWGGAMRGVGALGGGIAGSWDAMKQGYRAGKSTVAGTDQSDDQSQTSGPTQAGGQAAAGGTTAPAASGGAAAPAASGGTTVPAASGGAAASGGPAAPAASGAPTQTSSAISMNMNQINKLIPTLGKTDLENIKKNIDALIAKGGTASTKMSQQDQNALKARLKGQKQAGTSVAGQTGTGFKNYVAGSQTKLVGADKQGNPVFQKLQREGKVVESVHYSKFLGAHI